MTKKTIEACFERVQNNTAGQSAVSASAKKGEAYASANRKTDGNKRGSATRNRRAGNAAIYILLSVLGAAWVLPIVYLVYTAFR